MKLTTTFEKMWSKYISSPIITVSTRRVGVNAVCPYCKGVGKVIVIIYPMLSGKQIVFRGRKRCKIVRCSNCEHSLVISLDCLGADCGSKVKCLQYGIVIIETDHLKE